VYLVFGLIIVSGLALGGHIDQDNHYWDDGYWHHMYPAYIPRIVTPSADVGSVTLAEIRYVGFFSADNQIMIKGNDSYSQPVGGWTLRVNDGKIYQFTDDDLQPGAYYKITTYNLGLGLITLNDASGNVISSVDLIRTRSDGTIVPGYSYQLDGYGGWTWAPPTSDFSSATYIS